MPSFFKSFSPLVLQLRFGLRHNGMGASLEKASHLASQLVRKIPKHLAKGQYKPARESMRKWSSYFNKLKRY